jgi:hypothetical protein
MKECRTCGELLQLAEFYRHPKMADGHLNHCKSCVKKRVRQHRLTHLERVRQYDRDRGKLPHRLELSVKQSKRWRKEHPGANAAHHEVARAVEDGRLTKPERCAICGRKKKLEAHHPDYALKLHVIWCCCPCHKKIEHLDPQEEEH